jgi:hypothetical protein
MTIDYRPVFKRIGPEFAATFLISQSAPERAVSAAICPTVFSRDPVIKRESVWTGPVLRPAAILCDRLGGFVRIRDDAGGWSAPTPIS